MMLGLHKHRRWCLVAILAFQHKGTHWYPPANCQDLVLMARALAHFVLNNARVADFLSNEKKRDRSPSIANISFFAPAYIVLFHKIDLSTNDLVAN